MKLLAGVYDPSSVQSETQTLISQVDGRWSSLTGVSILNEAVDTGTVSASQAVQLTQQAQALLQSAGFSGPVFNVDTFSAILRNPELCNAGDVVGANCHAYFAGVAASDAGSYVKQQQEAVAAACSGKQVLITGNK